MYSFLKVTGRDTEELEIYKKRILNIACIVASGGIIPDEEDILSAKQKGRYWYHNTDHGNNRYDLFGVSNDWWAFIRDEGPTHIVLEFSYRYDRNKRAKLLTELLAEVFSYCCEVIEK